MEKRTIAIIAAIALVFILFLMILISAVQHKPSNKTAAQAVNPIAKQTNVEIGKVVDEPLVFDGLSIEIEGTITRWINKRTFYVSSGGGVFEGSSSLLVISSSDYPLPKDAGSNQPGLGEEAKVHIVGKARIIDKEKLTELTTIDLNSDKKEISDTGLASWDRGIVIVADKVEKL